MHHARRACSVAILATLLMLAVSTARSAEEPEEQAAYTLDVSDVSSHVGSPNAVHVTLRPREGYRILDGYNHRIIQLSSFDNDVTFARKVVPATVQDGALVFSVGVTPTAPGSHAINGVIRVGYIHGREEMAMVTMPLIAKVIGTP